MVNSVYNKIVQYKVVKMLRTFLQSYKKSLPPFYNKLISNLANHPNLIIHHPIEAVPSTHPLTTRIRTTPGSTVLKGVNIFMLSTSQSFSTEDLVGATISDRLNVDRFFQGTLSNYEMFANENLQGLFKVLIQIYANQQSIGGQMPLQDLSQLLFTQAYHDVKNPVNSTNFNLGLQFDLKKYQKYIRSQALLQIIEPIPNFFAQMHKTLTMDFIKKQNLPQFINLVRLVRAQLRQIHENSKIINLVPGEENKRVLALAPILPSLKESNTPNCILVGKYFTHLRQSFYCLQTLRQIKGGEQLTIPTKKINNYDRLMRNGYKAFVQSPDNPDNQYLLSINTFDPQIPQVAQIMAGDIQAKRLALSAYNLKLKNLIKINSKGQINKEDIKMLRILYGVVSQQQLEKDLIPVDKKIYEFVAIFVVLSLHRHSSQHIGKASTIEKDIDPDLVKAFRIIEQSEIKVLANFLSVKDRICKK